MFESDDYDQVLSQLDFPDVSKAKSNEQLQYNSNKLVNGVEKGVISCTKNHSNSQKLQYEKSVTDLDEIPNILRTDIRKNKLNTVISPKHTKRKIINAHFDHAHKRKFPGPAGLLTGSLQETKENSLSQIELLSQDIDSSQLNLQQGIFETPLWRRLLDDTKHMSNISTIKSIKQQVLAGNLRHKKAEIVRGFVDGIDRSAIDPMITLRDTTGHIQCTLHRDAWTNFASYIASEHCILILEKPTVLITGSAFKKHYLNITPSNIYFIYSSTLLSDEELPNGFVKISHEEFSIIKREKQIAGFDCLSNNEADELEGLDFSDMF